MSKWLFFTIVFYFFGWQLTAAQTGTTAAGIDYLDFKKQYALSCSIPDSMSILRSRQVLDSLANFKIIHGEKEFCYDRGWTHYISYLKWKKPDDILRAKGYWETGWQTYQDSRALWNLATAAKILGDCKSSLDYTEAYVNQFPDDVKNRHEQLYLRYKFCRGY
jgi:hypothetical protein